MCGVPVWFFTFYFVVYHPSGQVSKYVESMLSLLLLLLLSLLFSSLLISNDAVFIGLDKFKLAKKSVQNFFSELIYFNFCKWHQIKSSYLSIYLKCLVYHAETEQGVAQAIIRSVLDFRRDPWPRVSENAKDLVKRMLDPDPKRRLTAQEVLGNDWCFFW